MLFRSKLVKGTHGDDILSVTNAGQFDGIGAEQEAAIAAGQKRSKSAAHADTNGYGARTNYDTTSGKAVASTLSDSKFVSNNYVGTATAAGQGSTLKQTAMTDDEMTAASADVTAAFVEMSSKAPTVGQFVMDEKTAVDGELRDSGAEYATELAKVEETRFDTEARAALRRRCVLRG